MNQTDFNILVLFPFLCFYAVSHYFILLYARSSNSVSHFYLSVRDVRAQHFPCWLGYRQQCLTCELCFHVQLPDGLEQRMPKRVIARGSKANIQISLKYNYLKNINIDIQISLKMEAFSPGSVTISIWMHQSLFGQDWQTAAEILERLCVMAGKIGGAETTVHNSFAKPLLHTTVTALWLKIMGTVCE